MADFRGLPNPRKTAARLELLTSSIKNEHVLTELTASDIELIPEPQPSVDGGGCGFIPKDMLVHLMGGLTKGTRATSIQIRLVAPAIGIAKGNFVAKEGITKIQIPPSMIKVISLVV